MQWELASEVSVRRERRWRNMGWIFIEENAAVRIICIKRKDLYMVKLSVSL
jgi:hypothetical protein